MKTIRKHNPNSIGRPFVKGQKAHWKGGLTKKFCLFCEELFEVKPSRPGGGKFCNLKCAGKWWSENRRGSKSGNWRGGVSSENHNIRTSIQYRLWREAVFARDNWTCQECGDKKGGNLNAHHIKPFAKFPELRFAIDNGITYCKKCHQKKEVKKTMATKGKVNAGLKKYQAEQKAKKAAGKKK